MDGLSAIGDVLFLVKEWFLRFKKTIVAALIFLWSVLIWLTSQWGLNTSKHDIIKPLDFCHVKVWFQISAMFTPPISVWDAAEGQWDVKIHQSYYLAQFVSAACNSSIPCFLHREINGNESNYQPNLIYG